VPALVLALLSGSAFGQTSAANHAQNNSTTLPTAGLPPAGNTGSPAGVSGGPGLGDTPSTAATGSPLRPGTQVIPPAGVVPAAGTTPAGNTSSPAGLSGGPGLGDTPSTAATGPARVPVNVAPGTTGAGTTGGTTGPGTNPNVTVPTDSPVGVTRSTGAGILDPTTRAQTGTPSYGTGVTGGASGGRESSIPAAGAPPSTISNTPSNR
jgi:hypothetical protein